MLHVGRGRGHKNRVPIGTVPPVVPGDAGVLDFSVPANSALIAAVVA